MRFLAFATLLLAAVSSCKSSSSEGEGTGASTAAPPASATGDPLPTAIVPELASLGCTRATQVDGRKHHPELAPVLDKMIGGKAANLTMVLCESSARPLPRCDAIAELFHPSIKQAAHHFGVTVAAPGGQPACLRLYDHEGRLTGDLLRPMEPVIPPYTIGAAQARLKADGSLSVTPHQSPPCKLPSDPWRLADEERAAAFAQCLQGGQTNGLHVRAEPSVPFGRIMELAATVPRLATGSPLSLGPPLGLPRVACADDQLIRRPEASSTSDDDGVILIMTHTSLLVGDDSAPVTTFDGSQALAGAGFPASEKRCGQDDYFLKPLAARLPERVKHFMLIADPRAPYRAVWEVYYTLTRSRGGRASFMLLKSVTGPAD